MISVSDRYTKLDGDSISSQIRTLHDEVGRLTFPRKHNATFQETVNFTDLISNDNYDSTLRRNLLDAANGLVSMLLPVGDQGFSLKAPGVKPTDDAKKYYAECTEELVYQIRSNSNFIDSVGEATLEWWTFGTCGMRREWSERKDRLHFRNMLVNTYVISQNPEGDVDEVYVRMVYTAKDAAKEWGAENLPDEIRDRLTDETDKKTDEYIVGVFEVQDYDSPEIKKLAKGRRWLMMVEHKATKVRVDAIPFHDNPFSFGRWASITGLPYGFSPVWLILPEVRRLYRMQELADKLGLAALAPPIAALAKLKGRLNRGPLGVTYVDDMGEMPQVLQTSSQEYKIGMERIADAKKDIGEATYQDFFKLFSGADKLPETATLAQLMDAERSAQIGTPYQRYTQEFFAPQLIGAFKTLYRQGKMPEPPESLVVGEDKTTGQPDIKLPAVAFENRLVNALKAVENIAISQWWSTIGAMIGEVAPEEVKANLDWSEMLRTTFRNAVKNEAYVEKASKAADTKEAMAAAAQQAAQLEQAGKVAEMQP
jgi:hypothetical protein